jgi:hypothetical protein
MRRAGGQEATLVDAFAAFAAFAAVEQLLEPPEEHEAAPLQVNASEAPEYRQSS